MIIHAANIRIILHKKAENSHFSTKYYKKGGAEPFRFYSPFYSDFTSV